MRLSLALAAVTAFPASAFELVWPVDCDLGATCHIQQYVDVDPGPGARDFTCGGLSYDGHKGTDIALPTLADMRRGVAVRAAAAGRVAGVRDGMPDQVYAPEQVAALDGRECGNGVLIRHEDGYETQYCHLKQGSVRVRMGDDVKAGDPLGEVGLSGQTQFPHLHLSVRREGKVTDPFAPKQTECRAGSGGAGLWAAPVPYQAGALLDIGFAARVPDYDDVRAGRAALAEVAADAPAIVVFAFAYGGQSGDILRLSIDGPEGWTFESEARLDKAQARFFRAGGRKRGATPWPTGVYLGTITFLREGREIDRRSLTIPVR